MGGLFFTELLKWMRFDSFFKRIFAALKVNTKRSESMTLDLPDPLGPITALKFWWNGPSTTFPW